MGKKKVATQTTEEALKEKTSTEDAFTKAAGRTVSKRFEQGRVYIRATYNNTIISVTDDAGNLIAWSSA